MQQSTGGLDTGAGRHVTLEQTEHAKSRVNAVSAGPVRTLAARSIAGFTAMEDIVEERSPRRRHITADDVGAAAAYLLGDCASNVAAMRRQTAWRWIMRI